MPADPLRDSFKLQRKLAALSAEGFNLRSWRWRFGLQTASLRGRLRPDAPPLAPADFANAMRTKPCRRWRPAILPAVVRFRRGWRQPRAASCWQSARSLWAAAKSAAADSRIWRFDSRSDFQRTSGGGALAPIPLPLTPPGPATQHSALHCAGGEHGRGRFPERSGRCVAVLAQFGLNGIAALRSLRVLGFERCTSGRCCISSARAFSCDPVRALSCSIAANLLASTSRNLARISRAGARNAPPSKLGASENSSAA